MNNSPQFLAHVAYRTRQMSAMLSWYRTVFGATIQYRNPAIAFLTFDKEHHRLAFIDLEAIAPDSIEPAAKPLVGLDHLAWTYADLDALFKNYTRCKAAGILPYWCVHHGVTISMYYADPDGNQLEFQVNAFDNDETCNDYIRGTDFEANPVGVEFEPEKWLAAVRDGHSLDEFQVRTVHEPASPIRGKIGDLL